MPKIIVRQQLTPVFKLGRSVRVIAREASLDELITQLAGHKLDVVLQTIGIAKGLRMEIFAITAQRRLQHPGVVAMTADSG